MRGETVSHVFPDDGVYDVKLVVVDPFGSIAETTTPITVENVAPTVSLTTIGDPKEAAQFEIDLSLVEPGNDNTDIREVVRFLSCLLAVVWRTKNDLR